MNPRRLYRSRDRQLAGVAGGMAEYLNIDPTVSRILWILAAIVSGGLVIIAYIALAIITPENPYAAGVGPAGSAGWPQPGYGQPGAPQPAAGTTGWAAPPASPAWDPAWAARAAAQAEVKPQARGRGVGAAAIVGVVLIVIGAIAFADAVLPAWSSAAVLGPAVIIALGAALLVASIRRDDAAATSGTPDAPAGGQAGPATPGAPEAALAVWPTTTGGTDAGTETQPVGPLPLA